MLLEVQVPEAVAVNTAVRTMLAPRSAVAMAANDGLPAALPCSTVEAVPWLAKSEEAKARLTAPVLLLTLVTASAEQVMLPSELSFCT